MSVCLLKSNCNIDYNLISTVNWSRIYLHEQHLRWKYCLLFQIDVIRWLETSGSDTSAHFIRRIFLFCRLVVSILRMWSCRKHTWHTWHFTLANFSHCKGYAEFGEYWLHDFPFHLSSPCNIYWPNTFSKIIYKSIDFDQ